MTTTDTSTALAGSIRGATCDDHLSERFYSTCCRLGAKLRTLDARLAR